MGFETITSLQNPRLKNLVRLREANHRRRQRRFLIEGRRMVNRAIAVDWPLETLFFCEDLAGDFAQHMPLIDRLPDSMEFCLLSEPAFRKAAYRESPDGWLALGIQKEKELDSIRIEEEDLYLILEGSEKPGNVGAIMRTANAAGAKAVILAEPRIDLFNPNLLRSSQGAYFDLPLCQGSNEEIQNWLRNGSIETWVTSPDEGLAPWNVSLQRPLAIVLGAEDTGLSDAWLKGSYPALSLPTGGVTDSLNLSVTAGILTYEAYRQGAS